jgi:hypothetical protein
MLKSSGPFLPAVALLLSYPAPSAAVGPTPGVQWVADAAPGPSFSLPIASTHRLADGTFLVLESLAGGGASVVHVDAGGAAISTHELAVPPHSDIEFDVDPSGSVLVGVTTTQLQTWVMKFEGRTARPLWASPFVAGSPGAGARLRALARDANGDSFVSTGPPSPLVPIVTKVDGATGAVLWGPVSGSAAAEGSSVGRLAADADGNVLVATVRASAGESRIEALKFDGATGALLWGPIICPTDPALPLDAVVVVTVDGKGDFVLGGERSDAAGFFSLLFLAKFDGATGAVVWGPDVLPGAPAPLGVPFWFLRSDAASDLYVGTTLTSGSVTSDNAASSVAISAALDPAGAVYASFLDIVVIPDLVRSLRTVKVDGSTGNLAWGPVTLPDVGSGGLVLDSAGNVFLAVSIPSVAGFFQQATTRLVSYSAVDGSVLSGPTDLPPAVRNAGARSVAVDAAGDVVVLGSVVRDESLQEETWLLKYRGTTGAVVWGPVAVSKDIGGTPIDLKLAANGDPIWVGTAGDGRSGPRSITLTRQDAATGALVWGPLSPAGLSAAIALALALDGNGDILVLAQSEPLTFGFQVSKHDGRTGALMWGSQGPEFPFSFAVTPAGDAALAAGGDVFLLSGANGAVAWGPKTGMSAVVVAVDSSGDVVIESNPSTTEFDLRKLRGADGSLLWGPVSFAPPAGSFVRPLQLAVDPAGNPLFGMPSFDLVTGTQSTQFGKLSGTSGAVLWGPVTWTATGSLHGIRDVFLAVDPGGDLVVAADGPNPSFDDFVLRKYSGNDGSPVWGPVAFDGPGMNTLASFALAGGDPVLAGGFPSSLRAVRFGAAFSLETQDWQVPPAICDVPYSFRFETRNGGAPLSFGLVSGSLPPGLSLDSAAGVLSGVTGATGSYAFRLRATSPAGTIERNYTLLVAEGRPFVEVFATSSRLCLGDVATLSVAGSFLSHLWLPGGETTPTLSVSPFRTSTFGFVGTTPGGCVRQGSRLVTVLSRPAAPSISAPATIAALASGVPASVPNDPGSTFAWSVSGGELVSGQGTNSIAFTAGVGGNLGLTVVEKGPNGCAAPPASFQGLVVPVPTSFVPLTPCRVADTRLSGGTLAPGEVRRLTLAGSCGIPATARAVALNVTAVGVSGAGLVSVTPGGTSGPAHSGPSWSGSGVRAANAVIGLAAGGAADVSCDSPGGAVHVVIDVSGYFE